jgi:hypothetical protein
MRASGNAFRATERGRNWSWGRLRDDGGSNRWRDDWCVVWNSHRKVGLRNNRCEGRIIFRICDRNDGRR